MSIVSLEKFLYDARKRSEATPEPQSTGSYLELANRQMAAICRSVFVGETFSDLAAKLEELRKNLSVAGEPDPSKTAHKVEAILQNFQSRVRLNEQETAREFKGVLDILTNAFAQLSTRTEKSDERLKHLEAGLSRLSRTDDLGTLRSHVSRMLDFVRQESKADETSGRAELEVLSKDICKAHQFTSRYRLQIWNREQAIEDLKLRLAGDDRKTLYVGVFVVDALRALRLRHGDEIAANILQDLAQKEIQPVVPAGTVSCWSPKSILLVWNHENAAAAPSDLPSRLKAPFEHRAFVGTRTAVFTIVMRSMVRAAQGSVEEMVAAIDSFAKGGLA